LKANGRGTVLVVGGGISGITAAVEAAEVGCTVVLVEKGPFLGGRVARSYQYFPKLCPPHCGLEIHLRRLRAHTSVRILTLAQVEEIRGEPGRYQARIRQHPRMVNERCTACGACVDACPVDRADDFNLGMMATKAIYLPYTMAHPERYVVDGAACLGAAECGKCVPACPYDAIELDMVAEKIDVDVQAVIWATGWDPYDAGRIDGLGFGTYPNVITNVMMERLAAPNGPTGGAIRRPSDGGEIQSIAFVQCAGSRDENHLPYCSGVCCLGSLKQARYVREQYPDAQIYVFYIDLRAPGRLEDFLAMSEADERLHLVKGKVARIVEDADASTLQLVVEDAVAGSMANVTVDLVVLATGMVPASRGDVRVPGALSVDDDGFLTAEQSLGGMVAVGCAKRPTDVATCVRDATGAALKALHFCSE
jgi:quinone-modifying oxidoreductase subunit QmoA